MDYDYEYKYTMKLIMTMIIMKKVIENAAYTVKLRFTNTIMTLAVIDHINISINMIMTRKRYKFEAERGKELK